MKLAAAALVLVSSALVAGCAVYPDGSPAYATGGYSSYPAYPGGYDPGYYGAPVVQSGVVIGGGYYGGGPGPRYWDDGPGYRRPPPGGWDRGGDRGDRGGDRGDRGGNRGGDRGGDRGDRGGHGGQQAGGGPQGGGRPPQQAGGGPGAQPQPQQQQARTPYVGRSNWNKPSPVQGPQGSERNH